ncbi:MAG: hypothetical protein ABL984_02855 [Pyrinomonadaceae bacterium]
MPEKLKFRLSSMWLFVSLFTIILPVFVPSVANSNNPASNAIGVATAAMFILSFPSSLFGLVAMMFVNVILGMNVNSIEGLYVNLLVMFTLGLVQWFWIVPRIWNRDPAFQTVEIGTGWVPQGFLTRAVPEETFRRYDADGRTPVECVIGERSEAEMTDRHRTE